MVRCGAGPDTRFSRKDAKLRGLIRATSPICPCTHTHTPRPPPRPLGWPFLYRAPPGPRLPGVGALGCMALRPRRAAAPNRCYARASEAAHEKRVPLPLLQFLLAQCGRTQRATPAGPSGLTSTVARRLPRARCQATTLSPAALRQSYTPPVPLAQAGADPPPIQAGFCGGIHAC